MPYYIPRNTTQAIEIRSFLYNASHYHRLKRGEFERSFSRLDSLLRKRYTIQAENSCAVAGLSYGGRVTANIALGGHYQVVLFSPVISREQFPTYHGDRSRNCPSLYWVRIGRHDIFEPSSRHFRRHMRSEGLSMDYQRTPGSHNWKNWRQYLIDFLLDNYAPQREIPHNNSA